VSDTDLESPIRVFLVLQNRLLRDALERLFRKRADLLVVACDRQEDCTPKTIADSQCDVLVLDFLDERWLPAHICASTGVSCAIKSLLICMNDDSEQFLTAVRGGTTGYLLKEASTADVVSAVRSAFRGEAVCPPRLCAELFQNLSRTAAGSGTNGYGRPTLTLRQQRLAALVAKGMSNKEVAAHLNLSEFTVKNHMRRIMKRFGARSRNQAIAAILSHGYSLANNSAP
jgi:DNA-binding NarL/FixJ family response regulator